MFRQSAVLDTETCICGVSRIGEVAGLSCDCYWLGPALRKAPPRASTSSSHGMSLANNMAKARISACHWQLESTCQPIRSKWRPRHSFSIGADTCLVHDVFIRSWRVLVVSSCIQLHVPSLRCGPPHDPDHIQSYFSRPASR